MEQKIIQVPVEIKKMETMADKGIKFSVETPELPPSEQTLLFSFAHKQVFMAMAEGNIVKVEVPEVMPDIKGEKTSSQRLRAVIYLLWEANGKPGSGFPVFYETHLEKIINQYKELLPVR